jgi:hypothetical protein
VLPLAVPRAMLNLFSQFNNLPHYSSVVKRKLLRDPFGKMLSDNNFSGPIPKPISIAVA